MFLKRLGQLLVLSVVLCNLTSVWAQSDGREDLDKATELQLQIKSLNDISRVIELCESALRKGLEENDTDFAKELIVGSLWQRAEQLVRAIFESPNPGREWPRVRQMAMADLEKLLKHNDQFADAHLLVAKLQLLPRGNREQALKSVNRAVELFASDKEKLSEALVLRAGLQEDPQRQLADLTQAIEANQTNPNAWRLRAGYFIGRGELDKAVEDFEKLLETDQEDATLHQTVAEALINLKKFDLALKHIERAIELAPEASINYILRSSVHENRDDLKAAVADLDQALKIDPGAPGAAAVLLSRARLHYSMDDLPAARADVDRALELQPNSGGLLLRSLIAAAQGRFHEAIPDLQQILRGDPKNIELKLQLATFYIADQRPRKAISLLTEVVAATKETSDNEDQERAKELRAGALRGRADALLSIGKHAEAVKDYDLALELQPKSDGILNNLAWVLATSPIDEVRDGKRSIELAKRACEVTDYEMPHILSTLAAGYAESGDFEAAIKWSTKAVELGQEKLKDQVEQLKLELKNYEKGEPFRELQEVKEKPDLPRRIIET